MKRFEVVTEFKITTKKDDHLKSISTKTPLYWHIFDSVRKDFIHTETQFELALRICEELNHLSNEELKSRVARN